MSIRAKFYVASKTEFPNGYEIKLNAVISGSEENKNFYRHTPNGRLELSIVNNDTANCFEVGKEYYVDFTKAE